MTSFTDDQVRQRLAGVRDRIGRHETALAYLHQEEKELEVTLRVMERFDARQSFDDLLPTSLGAIGEAIGSATAAMAAAVERPSVTVPKMIQDVLARHALFADKADSVGMEPREIADNIREFWWPDAKTSSISPIVWRLWKEGRLTKEGARYSLPKNETPAESAAGASEPEE